MIEQSNENTAGLKRTHKKPYKVGKLFFGRSAPTRGAAWVVSASADLSNPLAEFSVGKLARAYCEETRDAARVAARESFESELDATSDVPAEMGIPSGEEPFDLLEDVSDEEELGGEIEL
ncbi:MAG: hypothetical protein CME70_18925 [Halobacteriovorax sp.]|nr:hypothetical protein [Halobacteriovorax sp.]|tara:strand:+ start:1869 stop:2228 length:360 start_codon:yes stop_codon:yes gene_type:complete